MSDILEDIKKMNIYEKMQKVKKLLSDSELKKTGENEYSKFEYYELADILPAIITFCEEYRLFTHVNFVKEYSIKITTTEERQTEEKVKVGESFDGTKIMKSFHSSKSKEDARMKAEDYINGLNSNFTENYVNVSKNIFTQSMS